MQNTEKAGPDPDARGTQNPPSFENRFESHADECLIIKSDEMAMFKNFIKKTPARIAVFDRNMCYLVTSESFLEDSLSSSKDVLGKCHYDVVPDIPQRWRKIHARALKGESFTHTESELFERAGGRLEWLKWDIRPWYQSENVIGGIILFIDFFTEQKSMHIKMQHMIRSLNRSNEDLERFAHICAHDLNEPLRTISSYCHLLEEDFDGTLSQGTRFYLDNVKRSVKQMGDLVNGLLTYSQFESSKLDIQKCSMNQILNTVMLVLERKINDKKATILYESLPDAFGDRTLLTCVLQNLIGNALTFNVSHEPSIHVTAKEGRKYTRYYIEDNGIGVDKKHYKTIFELFKRLHTTQTYQGAGIGLSLCKKIIEAHGGKIGVRSLPHKGSQFLFSLPKKPIFP